MSCFNPLINFVIFCGSYLMILLGILFGLEKDRGKLLFVLGVVFFVGTIGYLSYLQKNNIPNCNVVVERGKE